MVRTPTMDDPGTRRRLEAERDHTVSRLTGLTTDHGAVVAASRDTNADDEHDPEGATIAFERSQVDALIRQARAHLDELDAALARVDAGTYGVCESCDRTIPGAAWRHDPRLVAASTARSVGNGDDDYLARTHAIVWLSARLPMATECRPGPGGRSQVVSGTTCTPIR